MATATATSAASSATTSSSTLGTGQSSQGISLVAFLTALSTSLVIFGIQMFAFILLKDKLARILYVAAHTYDPSQLKSLANMNDAVNRRPI
jgi:hypothetical protein